MIAEVGGRSAFVGHVDVSFQRRLDGFQVEAYQALDHFVDPEICPSAEREVCCLHHAEVLSPCLLDLVELWPALLEELWT